MAYWDRVLVGGNKALQDAVDKHENGDDKPIPKVMEYNNRGIIIHTIPETAEALQVTPQTVRAYIKRED
jgi:hypothetical protein